MQIERWLKILGVDMVKNRYCQLCDRTLKLILSDEWKDLINWFFACWYRFTKIKSWSKIYWVGMVKNDCGQSGHETPKLAVSQKWADGINWFLACWYKFWKALKLIQWFFGGHVQNWQWSFLVHEAIKSAVF